MWSARAKRVLVYVFTKSDDKPSGLQYCFELTDPQSTVWLASSILMLLSNQPIEFTVQVWEPDVTHQASWLEGTGKCAWQPKAAVTLVRPIYSN